MEDVMLVEAGCHNGACAAGCLIGCLLTGGSTIAFGAAGGIIGAWE